MELEGHVVVSLGVLEVCPALRQHNHEIHITSTHHSSFPLCRPVQVNAHNPHAVTLKAQRHPMTSMIKDGVAQMTLPTVPRGVTLALQSLLGTTSSNNISEGASWVWTAIAVADSAAMKPRAIEYGVRLLIAALEQGFLKVDMRIPPTATHGEIVIASRPVGERIEVNRTFASMGGRAMIIKELVNIHVAVVRNRRCDLMGSSLLNACTKVTTACQVENTPG